ncbi:DUF4258 domain-containing protein [Candidatus Woesearchaeota archaeon]|nr:DUF4258 domain-containing protein [Candidatus Woesearchaeota archaeon]
MTEGISLVITEHAREQMFNRGIDEDQIKQAIRMGARFRQTDGFKSVYTYIGVCYKIIGSKYIVKTITIE